jgi:hypothetical protein
MISTSDITFKEVESGLIPVDIYFSFQVVKVSMKRRSLPECGSEFSTKRAKDSENEAAAKLSLSLSQNASTHSVVNVNPQQAIDLYAPINDSAAIPKGILKGGAIGVVTATAVPIRAQNSQATHSNEIDPPSRGSPSLKPADEIAPIRRVRFAVDGTSLTVDMDTESDGITGSPSKMAINTGDEKRDENDISTDCLLIGSRKEFVFGNNDGALIELEGLCDAAFKLWFEEDKVMNEFSMFCNNHNLTASHSIESQVRFITRR